MQTREEIIVEMLRRYTEAQEVLGRGEPGDERVPGMPGTWNTSYRQLERCLKQMRDERPSQYWHVSERFIRAEVLTLRVPFKKTAKGPVPKLPPHSELVAGAGEVGEFASTVRVRRWNPKVRAEKVRRGVSWLSETFPGEPYLPAEFREAA